MADAKQQVDRDSVFNNYAAIRSHSFVVSLTVEFIGVMFFQIIGGTSAPAMAPFTNGFALAVWIYTAANISGGHLNPAVTLSIFSCGFYPALHSAIYVILQIVGAIAGAAVTAGLVPDAYANMGDGGPGCFDRKSVPGLNKLTNGQIFGWEVVMTFTLISCVYACGVAKPGHGSLTPLAVGLSLLACAGAGWQHTGAALNPARVIGPLAVFKCGKDVAWLYILGELTAAVLACCVFAFHTGFGPINPYTSTKLLGLSWPEAVHTWITGSPPRRLRERGDENMNELLNDIKQKDRQGVVSNVGKTLSNTGRKLSPTSGSGDAGNGAAEKVDA